MAKYQVWLSQNTGHKVEANSMREAKRKVWNSLRGGFKYGWTRRDFLDNASVEKLS